MVLKLNVLHCRTEWRYRVFLFESPALLCTLWPAPLCTLWQVVLLCNATHSTQFLPSEVLQGAVSASGDIQTFCCNQNYQLWAHFAVLCAHLSKTVVQIYIHASVDNLLCHGSNMLCCRGFSNSISVDYRL